ncbi:DUF4114 domain-containing protein [Desulfobulbus rhabdoformis]|jgi:hypothetical protein|uniref:DUF4114 domain-containing protein n=1 Tax=Desulfobulbus rhabdoformis TaxID=34032 RepID=UPI001964FBDC|nr:DUF4114 domain-containing protein [Desulfobulbus rhabdoformis]MBM9614160.1 DUF4114 domain-containing protein [Desulfobulbus rhabdoformis]
MKKQLLKSALIAVAGIGLFSGSALATPGSTLQGVLDGITVAPNVGDSSTDVTTDYLSDNTDSYWNVTASGGSVATMIIELAGYANTNSFGIYDANDTNNNVELFGGSASTGSIITLSILLDGSVLLNGTDSAIDLSSGTFGYYLTSGAGYTYYSDTSLNDDAFDHMYAYQGTDTDTVQIGLYQPGTWTDNEFILAWEDLYNGGDQDFADMVLMVESVEPIPEPTTMLLFGSGLLGLAAVARKRKTA